jgi:hypothetical protein
MIRPLKMLLSILALVAVILCVWAYAGYRAISAMKTPTYKVIYKNRSYEIREYAPYIIIETVIQGDYDDAIAHGKKFLDSYVSGENASSTKIEGTFFLRESVSGEKGDTHYISYILPATYSLEQLPAPLTRDVRIHTISDQKVVVMQFAGNPSALKIDQMKRNLQRLLNANSVIQLSDPVYVRFTPTNIVPFLMRNEVQVVI